ncbi:unnamed protein product [Miscanthus lutarioriparius]|uniref:Uncharacterized protein n=1 Tax=Miscanthus lutarioriparius TaxID=422564 RepID=A0A811S2U2_9POAL|nr:unnamed protein product [Miscanthus lutarioriparius]
MNASSSGSHGSGGEGSAAALLILLPVAAAPPPASLPLAHDPDEQPLDRAKRRYLRKCRSYLLPQPNATTTTKPSSSSSEFVELRPKVVDFPRLHGREEALYFHDTFAMPWEKDKHYRMLYRLEKKSLVFFDNEKKEDEGGERVVRAEPRQVKREVPRVEERPQPYLVTRTTELPPRWDGPAETIVLIDKPKGSGILSKMYHLRQQ